MRTEPLAAINSVALAIGHFGTLNEMLAYALSKVLEVVQTEAGSVYVVDESRGELVLAVTQGLSERTRLNFDRLKIGEGLSGRVARDGEPIVLRNLKDDPRLTRMAAREEGFRAFASFPLRSSYKTYGTLNIHSRVDRAFSEEDVQLLTSMAAQIGLAVANTRLYLELEASERKFRGLVEGAEDLIYLTDAKGFLTYLNPAARRLLGLGAEPETAEPCSILSLVHPDDLERVTEALDRMLAGEIMRSFEYRLLLVNGGYRWVSQTNVPLRDEAANVVGMQCVAQDVTRRRELQDQIAQAERLADLGRMAANVAHEIRNPLGAIVNSISVLRRPGVAPDPRLLQIVTEEADRLDQIISEFLLFARPPARSVIACDLRELLDDTILLFRRDLDTPENVAIDLRAAPDLPLVTLDPNQFRQVFWNLLKNAVQAMRGHGTIDLAIAARPESGTVRLTITDDGEGIADPARLFEPFYTTRAEGTGLGLAVVARIVQDHGGTVTAMNLPGRGARFCLELPLDPERAARAVRAEAAV